MSYHWQARRNVSSLLTGYGRGAHTVDLMGTREAAKLLGVHLDTLRRYCREGKLRSTKVSGVILIERADLDRFVAPVPGRPPK